MLSLYVRVRNWLTREDGQGMTEYAMIIGLVALGLIVIIGLFTGQLSALFGRLRDAVQGIAPTTP